jgi:3-deoxy-D-manno-octulosonate 8-phosphate phosphatase (KDO 8-P phosphatase)
MESSLAGRAARIEWLILDVDGVLTDGRIVYGTGGLEVKRFHVRDGSGLKLWHLAGKRSAIITGRESPIVAGRAAELGITCVVQGAADKRPAFDGILSEAGVQPEQVCYVGDDLPDLPVLVRCGLPVAVADACMEVREGARFVTRNPGGQGAVREVIELILRCQGIWAKLVARLLEGTEVHG